jgi:sugar phosphate permease
MITARLTRSVFTRGCLIWLLATIFYFFDNLLNVFPSAIKPELLKDFACNAADLGMLTACFGWAYGIMQIPAGALMDTIGPRRLFTMASLLTALGCLLFGVAETFMAAKVGRVFIGLGASVAVVGCTKIASVWFAPNRFAFFIGLMVSVGFCGPVFGLSMITHVLDIIGSWQETMLLTTIIALGLSFVFWLFMRDKPADVFPEYINKHQTQDKSEVGVWQGIIEVVSCKQAWFAAIYAGLMFVPTFSFGGLWATPYLVEAHGFTREMAGFLAGQIFIGWIFGGPIYGWISDHLGRRNIPMYVANISTFILMVILIYAKGFSPLVIGVLMFALGFCSSGFVIAFAVVRENNRTVIAGTAIGFINTLNTLFPAGFQVIIGKVLDSTSNTLVFSLENYQKALLTIPAGLILSFLTLTLLKETYCKPKEV